MWFSFINNITLCPLLYHLNVCRSNNSPVKKLHTGWLFSLQKSKLMFVRFQVRIFVKSSQSWKSVRFINPSGQTSEGHCIKPLSLPPKFFPVHSTNTNMSISKMLSSSFTTETQTCQPNKKPVTCRWGCNRFPKRLLQADDMQAVGQECLTCYAKVTRNHKHLT